LSPDHNLLTHERFLHPSSERLALLGFKHTPGSCEPCILGKQTRSPFRPIEDKTTEKLGRVYIDHCGPITPITIGNGKYALDIRDEATSYTWTYIVPDRSAETIITILKTWKPMVENQAGTTLKIIRTDDAKEFKSVHRQYLKQFGVIHESTAPHSSSSNGPVERVHRTLFDMVRPMLIRSKLPTPLWGEAICTAAKVLNRLPTKANPDNISPHEAWFGKKPCTSHLRQFGCVAYARIPTKVIGNGNKPAPRSIKCCMLGYIGNRMYRLWDPERKKPFKSRDVVFKENEFLERDAFQNISQDFSPLVIEFNYLPDNEPEDLSEPPTLTNDSVNDGFTTPKHPAQPQYLPPTPPTPLAIPPNRYALLAPIPPTPVTEPDYESDSDDENDDLPQCATPDTESDTPSTPPLADVQSDPISNQSSESASPSNSETSPPSDISPLPETAPQTSSTPYPARIRKPSEKAREAKETEKLIQEQRSKPRMKATSTDTSANRTSPFEPPNEPKSTEEARASPQAQQWHDAEIEEINSLNEREV